MSQIFRPSSNKFAQFSIIATLAFFLLLALSAYGYFRSPSYSNVGVFREQPLPFSHKHHVQGLGLDCRFCHSAVEISKTAGMPSTEVCMSCHVKIFNQNADMSALHKSFEENRPLIWNRVNDLPDFVYFNHSIHVNKGVACISCHGVIKEMPLTAKASPFTMKWCLGCHANPVSQLVEQKDVFRTDKKPSIELNSEDQKELFRKLHIDRQRLNNCTECHR